MPKPVVFDQPRHHATTIVRPIRPYTTDGMPTSNSTTGWNTVRPNLGEISTTKMADPKANGKASSVESSVTENDPTIMGSAPTVGAPDASAWCGFHVVPVKNAVGEMPSTKNVAKPCWATMNTSVATRSTISVTHAPESARPTLSSLFFDRDTTALNLPFKHTRTQADAKDRRFDIAPFRLAPNAQKKPDRATCGRAEFSLPRAWSRCRLRRGKPSCRKPRCSRFRKPGCPGPRRSS